jgi:excisionase family DNA binding protein
MAKKKAAPSGLLSVAEAAAAIGVSESAVKGYARSGRLPGQRLGARAWVFTRAAVAAFVPPPMGRPKKEAGK